MSSCRTAERQNRNLTMDGQNERTNFDRASHQNANSDRKTKKRSRRMKRLKQNRHVSSTIDSARSQSDELESVSRRPNCSTSSEKRKRGGNNELESSPSMSVGRESSEIRDHKKIQKRRKRRQGESKERQVTESRVTQSININPKHPESHAFRSVPRINETARGIGDDREAPAASARPLHPFEADDADHCETPLSAYKDIAPLLDQIAASMGKNRTNLRIYDPYYCNGGVQKKLASLGFANVTNENEDFYGNIRKGTVPDYDVLLTNPPYSGSHIAKLLRFVSQSGSSVEGRRKKGGKKKEIKGHSNDKSRGTTKPFLLLLPHFVYTKDYYKGMFPPGDDNSEARRDPFFLIPRSRYAYVPPSWVGAETGSTAIGKGKVRTAPFPSFWYCSWHGRLSRSGTSTSTDVHSWLTTTYGQSGVYRVGAEGLQFASCTAHIPREMRGEFDLNKKRPNPRARKRMLAKKKRMALAGPK